jgi:peptidyl-prolyl cis-trans isomerase C
MKRLIREPLVHFVLATVLIFGAYAVLNSGQRGGDTIYVSKADMERMAQLYAVEANASPSDADLEAMIVDHVRQEALVREAKSLGLDQGDTVVERRLAQKMTFMLADMADTAAPAEGMLKDWYAQHPERFVQPPLISFQHVYFRGQPADILTELQSADGNAWQSFGDPFILQRAYADLPPREVTRLFGGAFAATLFETADTPNWFGPISSAYGAHFVRILSRSEAAQPPFETVKADVLADWSEYDRRDQNDAAVAAIISKYNVEIEGLTE